MLRRLCAASILAFLAGQPVTGQGPVRTQLPELPPKLPAQMGEKEKLLAEIQMLQFQLQELIKKEKGEAVVHEREVFILQKITDKRTGKLIRSQKVESSELSFDKRDGRTMAMGPGRVASFCPDGPNQGRLTRVEFAGRFHDHARENGFHWQFFDKVEVWQLSATHPDVECKRTLPPTEGFYLTCQLLHVHSDAKAGKSAEHMEASQNVTIQTKEFFARADVVKVYDGDLFVFEANPGNLVTVIKLPGGEVLRGAKVIYHRTTGEFNMGGASGTE